MSTIAVIGATGTAGSRVVARLKSRDVAVVEISRAHGVDLFNGPELSQALEGTARYRPRSSSRRSGTNPQPTTPR